MPSIDSLPFTITGRLIEHIFGDELIAVPDQTTPERRCPGKRRDL